MQPIGRGAIFLTPMPSAEPLLCSLPVLLHLKLDHHQNHLEGFLDCRPHPPEIQIQ